MSDPLIWIRTPPVQDRHWDRNRLSRWQWDLRIAENVQVTLFLRDDEYFAQCSVGHMPILGKSFKGVFIGTTELPLETAQATALGKAYDEVSNVLQAIEQAMYEAGHEVEPLVPDGALDHRGRP